MTVNGVSGQIQSFQPFQTEEAKAPASPTSANVEKPLAQDDIHFMYLQSCLAACEPQPNKGDYQPLKLQGGTTVEDVMVKGSTDDKGGHGGNLKVKVGTEPNQSFFFLKPISQKDQGKEFAHYQIIGKVAPNLAAFMPKMYGKVTDGGQEYMVLKNSLVDEQGKPKEQLVDAKLAGKVEGENFNPIHDKNEYPEKPAWDSAQMKLGSDMTPDGFMVASGSVRLLHYSESSKNLSKQLEGVSPENLSKLQDELRTLQVALDSSPLAGIGISIILIKDGEEVHPMLIDPAHVNFDRESKIDIIANAPPDFIYNLLYFGEPETYQRQKVSNHNAIDGMIFVISSIKTATVAEEKLESANTGRDTEEPEIHSFEVQTPKPETITIKELFSGRDRYNV